MRLGAGQVLLFCSQGGKPASKEHPRDQEEDAPN